jgi:hypothetical protein
MRKLSLDPESLVVQAFSTTDAVSERGTVHGLTGDQDTCVGPATCAPGCTRQDTCATCPASCFGTCATCGATACNPAQCPSADGRC